MPQNYIQEYYRLQNESFCDHVKTVVSAKERIMNLKGDQVIVYQRAVMRGVKALYFGRLIEDIKRNIASGNVTMEPMEKRVQLNSFLLSR